MDLLMEKWEAIAGQPGVKIIRIHAAENEKDMVDAFYSYLLGVDTENHDIPIIFESIYHDDLQYTHSLLNELKDLIDLWNNASKDELTIETKNIDWTPDFNIKHNGNPAYLFTENLNRLALHLELGKSIFLVAVLKVSFVHPKRFCQWLEFALKAGINEKFKIVVDDSALNPVYHKLAAKYPGYIATLEPKLDMDKAMQQVAAMGNPNDPAVQYRQAFLKMMLAIEKRNEADSLHHATTCIAIAEQNIPKNKYWVGQVIAVYCALANDQVGYKNFKKAIDYASRAVEVAQQSKELITEEFVHRKFIAQAVMMRGSLYSADKNWVKAIDDFNSAAHHYLYTNDVILAMEATRMVGYCNIKYGNKDAACKALADALEVAKQIPVHTAKYTTLPGVLELLIQFNNRKYISQHEVEEVAESIYGKDWMKEIMNWKNPHYEQVTDPVIVMNS